MVSSTVTTYGGTERIEFTPYTDKETPRSASTDGASEDDDFHASEHDYLLDKHAGSLNGSSEDSPGYFAPPYSRGSPVSEVTDRTDYEEEDAEIGDETGPPPRHTSEKTRLMSDEESVKPVRTPQLGRVASRPEPQPSLSSASKRAAVAAAELNDDVLVGTRVSEGHENFVTAYNMLTGIRVAVSRCTAKNNRPLTSTDFSETDEISFDLNGGGSSPSSKYIFQFKDYSPWVFRHLRDAFKLDPADYLMSLTSKYIVSELGSPGKSGSFFYYSRDYRFIIKTIHHSEHKLLRRVLRQYYGHILKNPDTLISQFYGLHRVRLPFGRKIHFVVMNNVFPALYEIHERYDLKGSLYGREYKPDPNKPIAVFKDLDWMRRHKRIILGPEKRERLIRQLETDVRFLERINVMDYSLLVGVHSMSEGNAALNALLNLAEFGPKDKEAPQTERRVASAAVHRGPQGHTAQKEFAELQTMLQRATPERLKEFDFADEYRSEFYFYHEHGGFMSTDSKNDDRDIVYYLGIIDFLTPYNFRKSVETFCKGLLHDRKDLSAVPAQEYGERFLRFMRGSIGPEIHPSKSSRQSVTKSRASEHVEDARPAPQTQAEQAAAAAASQTGNPSSPAVSSAAAAAARAAAAKADPRRSRPLDSTATQRQPTQQYVQADVLIGADPRPSAPPHLHSESTGRSAIHGQSAQPIHTAHADYVAEASHPAPNFGTQSAVPSSEDAQLARSSSTQSRVPLGGNVPGHAIASASTSQLDQMPLDLLSKSENSQPTHTVLPFTSGSSAAATTHSFAMSAAPPVPETPAGPAGPRPADVSSYAGPVQARTLPFHAAHSATYLPPLVGVSASSASLSSASTPALQLMAPRHQSSSASLGTRLGQAVTDTLPHESSTSSVSGLARPDASMRASIVGYGAQ